MQTLPFFLFIFITSSFIADVCYAGTITKNSDKKIILDFEGETVPAPKDRVYVLDQTTHKEIGLVEIIKVKESRALGELVKGSAKPGDTTDTATTDHKRDEERTPAEVNKKKLMGISRNEKTHSSRLSYGGGLDFVYTSMYLKNTTGEGSITGNGFGVRGAIDIPLNSNWLILSSVGLHPLNVTSTTSGFNYSLSSNYLAFEGVFRYVLDKRHEGLWMGGGLGFYVPMSTNSTIKATNDLTLLGSGGYNMRLSRDYLTLKMDVVLFQNKTIGSSTTQTFQLVFGGIYFF